MEIPLHLFPVIRSTHLAGLVGNIKAVAGDNPTTPIMGTKKAKVIPFTSEAILP